MHDVCAGGDGLVCDVDVVRGFTANDGGGIVDGISECRRWNAFTSDVVRAYPHGRRHVSSVHWACNGDVSRKSWMGEQCATEREDDESETAQRYKARWPMRYVGKQHANSVGDVSGCSKGIDQNIRRRLDFVAREAHSVLTM